jgi:ABC-type phosphate transport system permease subunit
MKHAKTADTVLRSVASVGLVLAVPFQIFVSIFITDSGTPDAMRRFQLVVVGILAGATTFGVLLVWPHKIERVLPGPYWLRMAVVRGPIYLFALAMLALLVWLGLRKVA